MYYIEFYEVPGDLRVELVESAVINIYIYINR